MKVWGEGMMSKIGIIKKKTEEEKAIKEMLCECPWLPEEKIKELMPIMLSSLKVKMKELCIMRERYIYAKSCIELPEMGKEIIKRLGYRDRQMASLVCKSWNVSGSELFKYDINKVLVYGTQSSKDNEISIIRLPRSMGERERCNMLKYLNRDNLIEILERLYVKIDKGKTKEMLINQVEKKLKEYNLLYTSNYNSKCKSRALRVDETTRKYHYRDGNGNYVFGHFNERKLLTKGL